MRSTNPFYDGNNRLEIRSKLAGPEGIRKVCESIAHCLKSPTFAAFFASHSTYSNDLWGMGPFNQLSKRENSQVWLLHESA